MGTTGAPAWKDGVLAGFAGSVGVISSLSVVDAMLGRTVLHTPAVLGTGLLGGPLDESRAVLAVLSYTGLHLGVFVVLGVMLVRLLDRNPADRRWPLVIAFLLVFIGSAMLVRLLDPVGAALPTWSLVLADVAALVLMGAVLSGRSRRD